VATIAFLGALALACNNGMIASGDPPGSSGGVSVGADASSGGISDGDGAPDIDNPDEPDAAPEGGGGATTWMWSTYGDSRCSLGGKHLQVLQELVASSPDSELVWNLGDIVPGSGWDTLFADITATLGPNTQTEMPYYYGVTGDHDGDGTADFNTWLSRQTLEYGNGGNGWNNVVPHNNALFVNLNLKDYNGECADGGFIHSAVTAGGYDWLFGVYHYNNSAGDCEALLEAAGMDGYFWGHAHSYGVTSLGGAISINTGLGGCGTEYMEVKIDGDTATLRQIAVGGTTKDTQTITRRPKTY